MWLQARRFATVLARHCAVMDAHDPERQVGLAVDEWGCWYAPEPAPSAATSAAASAGAAAAREGAAGAAASGAAASGAAAAVAAGGSAPAALLEQRGTLRDGLVTALCLHAMAAHAERVRLANLAQACAPRKHAMHARTLHGALVHCVRRVRLATHPSTHPSRRSTCSRHRCRQARAACW